MLRSNDVGEKDGWRAKAIGLKTLVIIEVYNDILCQTLKIPKRKTDPARYIIGAMKT